MFRPSPALAPFVRIFHIVETTEAATRTLLPDTGLALAFRYSGGATLLDGASARRLPNVAVTGLRTSARQMHTSANGGLVVAKFRAAGAAAFFSGPQHHLFGLTCELDDVLHEEHDGHGGHVEHEGHARHDVHAANDWDVADAADVGSTSHRIAEAAGDTERVGIFERFLRARHRPTTPDRLVAEALRAIGAAGGGIRVRTLARDLGVSQDTLEKRFRRVVGASPKQFASIVRVQRAVDLARTSGSGSLATLALDAGYYDQSHFIRDFRAVTGAAPGHFFESATYC